ncbi:MAG: hypothetical protein ACRDYU_08035 [Actinomycetes bacterium]
MMVNRYDAHPIGPDGAEGPTVAFAQQKRMALREQVTFYTDDTQRDVLFSFKARQMMDVSATYDVSDAAGTVLGTFRKDFGASLLRSTFHLAQEGAPEATGAERSMAVALVRRFADVPLPVHFDFTAGGQPVMSVTRAFALRDAYRVEVPAPWLDRRLALAMAVGLDALMAR